MVGFGLGEWVGGEDFWVRVRRNGFEGLTVIYGKSGGKQGSAAGDAHRGAAAQEELARRTPASVEDLATFFSAYERTEAVDEWLAARQ